MDNTATTDNAPNPFCEFCPHPLHTGQRCPNWHFADGGMTKVYCKCKGKAPWWKKLAGGLGNAIGESLFGGDR